MRWFFFDYFMPSRKVMMSMVSDWLYLIFRGQRRELFADKKTNQENNQTSRDSIKPDPFSMPMGI
jgi:hypothetical protein